MVLLKCSYAQHNGIAHSTVLLTTLPTCGASPATFKITADIRPPPEALDRQAVPLLKTVLPFAALVLC